MTKPCRSAARSAFHLQEATTCLAVVAGHLAAAREADPNPETSDTAFKALLADTGALSSTIRKRIAEIETDVPEVGAA